VVRDILTYPNKTLKKVSKEVMEFNSNLHNLLDDMYETMIKNTGIGLAAIQVGVPLRIFIINIPDNSDEQLKENLVEIINPEILEHHDTTIYQEGCLSLPGIYEDVQRYKSIAVRYQDRDGNKIEETLDSIMAIAFQHELDHLNGHLFIEKLSYLKRKKFEKEWKKQLKNKEQL
jgi:peptide deformylase